MYMYQHLCCREEINNLKEGETEKTKVYSALCFCTSPLSRKDLENLSGYKARILDSLLSVEQFLRVREIKDYNQDVVLQQKTPIRVLHSYPKSYVKEFVHGDFGRTKPNLSSITGVECDILELDVEKFNMDTKIPLIFTVKRFTDSLNISTNQNVYNMIKQVSSKNFKITLQFNNDIILTIHLQNVLKYLFKSAPILLKRLSPTWIFRHKKDFTVEIKQMERLEQITGSFIDRSCYGSGEMETFPIPDKMATPLQRLAFIALRIPQRYFNIPFHLRVMSLTTENTQTTQFCIPKMLMVSS
ncbi:hypothetical protein KUTeg_014107 [Tegillarca granosa]|uniref:tRNA pseudouridine(55) synthase n=1 Tax=Tegillarca granosa TaxID=220873 RepID=A0ABQ9EVQ3_TEGGR|nr:hypothetical protein KUTeg_014107 [Tegillarca granosa]